MDGRLTRDGYALHFEVRGAGPRLIWVDPALASRAMRPMEAALEVLTERFEVVTYDRRGRGLNEDADEPSARADVDDLVALVAHLGGADVVAGFSSGGALVLHAAPRLSAGAIALVEPAVSDTPDGSGLRESIQRHLAADDPESAVREFYEATGTPEEIVQGLADSPAWAEVVRCAPTLLADIDLAVVNDDVLDAIRLPFHVIVSDGSPPEITGMGEALAGRAHACLWREPGGWHGVDPRPLSARLASFV